MLLTADCHAWLLHFPKTKGLETSNGSCTHSRASPPAVAGCPARHQLRYSTPTVPQERMCSSPPEWQGLFAIHSGGCMLMVSIWARFSSSLTGVRRIWNGRGVWRSYYWILCSILTPKKTPWFSKEEKGNQSTDPWRLREGKQSLSNGQTALVLPSGLPIRWVKWAHRHKSCKSPSSHLIFPSSLCSIERNRCCWAIQVECTVISMPSRGCSVAVCFFSYGLAWEDPRGMTQLMTRAERDIQQGI